MGQNDLQVIVGLGATGLSVLRYLDQGGFSIAINDTRDKPPNLDTLQSQFPHVKLSLGELDEALLAKATRIILSPGIAKSDPRIAKQIERGIPVVGDIELFAEKVTAPVIAITGTNAKSTVTTLVGLMAEKSGIKVATGGNLGVPVLDLLALNPTSQLFVLELSSFQLETTYQLAPLVAAILNITPDHMDRYPDLASYQAAKHRVYRQCQLAVCNRDDPLTWPRQSDLDTIYFSLNKPDAKTFGLLEKNHENYLALDQDYLLPVSSLPIVGRHYQANALAALAIGHAANFPMKAMLDVLQNFKGLPHRCQYVRTISRVHWFNDSKGTNVGATQAAIQGLAPDMAGQMIWIGGGVGKNADFSPLAPLIKQYARHSVLIGEAADEIAKTLGDSSAVTFAESMEEAVSEAYAKAEPNDYVLLSPACASFDMFKHFEHRGDVFMAIVQGLSNK